MAGRRRGCRRRGGRGRSLGWRRVPAARSLAPTLLNGFLGLDVYLSFVFASVAQLPHRTLTATFLGFSAARGGSCWTCAPAPGLGAHSPAPGGHPAPGWHPRSRAYRVGPGARPRTRDPRSRSGLKCASSLAWLRNGGGGSSLGKPRLSEALCPEFGGSCAGPVGPSGTREMLGADSRGDPSPRAFTPFTPRGLPSGKSREYPRHFGQSLGNRPR